MPYCKVVDLPDGQKALVRMAGQQSPRCKWCLNQSTKLCDHIISNPAVVTHKSSCDAPMCDLHSIHVGKDRDLCFEHAKVEGFMK